MPVQVLPQKDCSPQRNNVRAQEESEKEGAAQRSHFVPGTPPVPRSFWLLPASLKGLTGPCCGNKRAEQGLE